MSEHHDIDRLLAQLQRFEDPTPRADLKQRIKSQVRQALELEEFAGQQVAPQVRAQIKTAVHGELERQRRQTQFWRTAGGLLAAAAALALLVLALSNPGLEAEDSGPFEIQTVTHPELQSIDAALEELELAHDAREIMGLASDPTSEFLDSVDYLMTPDYRMNFDDETTTEGVI